MIQKTNKTTFFKKDNSFFLKVTWCRWLWIYKYFLFSSITEVACNATLMHQCNIGIFLLQNSSHSSSVSLQGHFTQSRCSFINSRYLVHHVLLCRQSGGPVGLGVL